MSKFVDTLTQSNKNIRKQRAQNLGEQAKIEQENLVNELKNKKLSIDNKIDDLADIAPESTTSLKMQDVDPSEWTQKMQQLKVDRLEIEIQLKVAQETYNEWFGGEDA